MDNRDSRLERFVDPSDLTGWLALQRVQLDNMRTRIITMRYGGNADTTGMCQQCNRPFDDHELTWASDWYPSRLCPTKVVAPTPIPAEYPRDDMDYSGL